jgi:hypothetical protein
MVFDRKQKTPFDIKLKVRIGEYEVIPVVVRIYSIKWVKDYEGWNCEVGDFEIIEGLEKLNEKKDLLAWEEVSEMIGLIETKTNEINHYDN